MFKAPNFPRNVCALQLDKSSKGGQTDNNNSEQSGITCVMQGGKDRVTFAKELATELQKPQPDLSKFIMLNSDKISLQLSLRIISQKLQLLDIMFGAATAMNFITVEHDELGQVWLWLPQLCCQLLGKGYSILATLHDTCDAILLALVIVSLPAFGTLV